MAIYHLHVQVIGRKTGRSAVAAAAYRSASRLRDERLGRSHDFTGKTGVVHSEVMLPEGASEEWKDREQLWNDVEAAELRKDAQLAREIEFAIPREMNQQQGVDLARDFVQAEFVDHCMVADLNVHWDIGTDGMARPHAHVMLTMREATADENGDPAFGQKVRDWNRTELVERWRERWATHVNERLAELDIDARIDHRSFAAQGIGLEPQNKIGATAGRIAAQGLEADRAEEHRKIARANGERIIQNPRLALDAITHQQSTFTRRDLAMFAHRHSDGVDQFNDVMSAVRQLPDLVELGQDGRGEDRFTSRDMIEAEQRLLRSAELMAKRERHRVADRHRDTALAGAQDRGLMLSGEQRDAFDHVTKGANLGLVVGHAGTGKSAMLGVAREAWEDAGFTVRGAALSGIAAENLESGSGIASRTLASMEHGWEQGRDLLTASDVLVIDEAGMVGTRQLERVLSHAADAGAKVVLVGDPQQLQSIEAGAAFRALHERHGGIEITQVRRQHEDWQRDATRDLATGQTGTAISAYDEHGMVHTAATREDARGDLINSWDRDRRANPGASRMILTHTNGEVRELNMAARERMRASGDLGEDVRVTVTHGERDFAPGDRVMFLRNERGLAVKNGTLGAIEEVTPQSMTVRTDDGRSVFFDTKDYADIDHGYAATIHKAQGMTVDRTHVLATPGMDAHGSYVALSRHRDGVDLHYGHDDFADQDKLVRTLSRDRSKDMASDYEQADPARDFAERRGLTLRERVAEIVKKIVPEKVRNLFDGLRLHSPEAPDANAAQQPERESEGDATPQGQRQAERAAPAREQADPEAELRRARTRALARHARAVDAVFKADDGGGKASPDQMRELRNARKAFEEVRPYGWRDAEAAYAKDPSLASEAAGGKYQRAVNALQLESELRIDNERSDKSAARGQTPESRSRSVNAPAEVRRFEAEEQQAALRRARGEALARHARAVDAYFKAEDAHGKAGPEQQRELTDARKAFDEVRPYGWRDAEAAYAKDPSLASEAADGKYQRAVSALQRETGSRMDNERADKFIERWEKLDERSQHQYRVGNMSGYKAARAAMGDMARSLERDPQMESILANRKRELGISFDSGRSLGRELALSRGIDYDLGRGLGL